MLSPALPIRDLPVPLPPRLRRFGDVTTVRLVGGADGPLVAALGGISGNRFVCRDAAGGSGWWPGLVGAGCAIDPQRQLVLGLDFAADGSGRSAPSTADQAEVLSVALAETGRERFTAIVGASYGGMVALQFAEAFPSSIGRVVAISAPASPHPAATAVRELQRRIVELGLRTGSPDDALAIARGVAMLTYRTPQEFAARFSGGLPDDDPASASDVGSYLRARGQAFASVMTPERFLSLSASIDRHLTKPQAISVPTLLVGATSDQLVPPGQLEELAERLSGKSELHLLDSLYGHDMFLKEATRIGRLVGRFLDLDQ